MKSKLTILLILTCLTACNFLDTKPKEKQDFYSLKAGWDIKHIPLITPFKASSTAPKGQWLINGTDENLHLGKNKSGDIPVKSIGVSKNYIYGQTDNDSWFLFDVNTFIYSEYKTENELSETLKIFKLDKNHIIDCDVCFQQLSENKRMYWFPKAGEQYKVYDNYKPEKVYDIFIDGNQTVKNFKISESIKKTNSKIYYFKTHYENKSNDLFYVSFDNSNPKLVKDNQLFIAYCEDNFSLEISVYTPFPVAEKKGIDEKNRVVISKQFDLK